MGNKLPERLTIVRKIIIGLCKCLERLIVVIGWYGLRNPEIEIIDDLQFTLDHLNSGLGISP